MFLQNCLSWTCEVHHLYQLCVVFVYQTIFLPVGEIAPEIWPVLWFFNHFWKNLTFTLTFGRLGHWMRLIGLYLGTNYEVCRWNSLQDMTSSLVFYPFFGKIIDLDLWPWPKVVIGTWVIECALLGCTLVPTMKCVGEIASKIWQVLRFFFTHF